MIDFAANAFIPASFATDPKHLVTIIVVAVAVTIASYVVNYFTKRR